jgi:hypothetical protein
MLHRATLFAHRVSEHMGDGDCNESHRISRSTPTFSRFQRRNSFVIHNMPAGLASTGEGLANAVFTSPLKQDVDPSPNTTWPFGLSEMESRELLTRKRPAAASHGVKEVSEPAQADDDIGDKH